MLGDITEKFSLDLVGREVEGPETGRLAGWLISYHKGMWAVFNFNSD
jgi:hypothetical protein